MPELNTGERLAVVETKVSSLVDDVDSLKAGHSSLKEDFTILKTRMGLIAAGVAVLFTGLVNVFIDWFKGLS